MSILKDYCFLYFILTLIVLLGLKCKQLKYELLTQKEYFIKTLGHDFRVSIIAQIRGLDLIQKGLNSTNDDYKLVNEINDSCKYTLDMVTMLMNIYKIENKDLLLNYEILNLSDVINDVLTEFTEIASEKNIDFNSNIKHHIIIADKENFIKVLKILILKALQYSERNSILNISFELSAGKNLLCINYKGKPLTFEEENRMLSKNPNFSTVGHGIQMHLCKKIIDLHKGKLAFKTKLNKYNTFEISIPVHF